MAYTTLGGLFVTYPLSDYTYPDKIRHWSYLRFTGVLYPVLLLSAVLYVMDNSVFKRSIDPARKRIIPILSGKSYGFCMQNTASYPVDIILYDCSGCPWLKITLAGRIGSRSGLYFSKRRKLLTAKNLSIPYFSRIRYGTISYFCLFS